jgi:hypothetical protein
MIMSIKHSDAEAQLKRDVESYLKGKQPSAQQLAVAPQLANWRSHILPSGGASASPMVLVLTGDVHGHPRLGDEKAIRTSQIVWLDPNRKWARTWNRIYRLGQQASDDAHQGVRP